MAEFNELPEHSRALRDGNFFATTGEILITNYAVAGIGAQRSIGADVEWTFPLSFVEVVWGDGRKVDRKIISATGCAFSVRMLGGPRVMRTLATCPNGTIAPPMAGTST